MSWFLECEQSSSSESEEVVAFSGIHMNLLKAAFGDALKTDFLSPLLPCSTLFKIPGLSPDPRPEPARVGRRGG